MRECRGGYFGLVVGKFISIGFVLSRGLFWGSNVFVCWFVKVCRGGIFWGVKDRF